jgi:PHD/YefM family antitoxin component YafN of YafNO toxin-antitoxin module
MRLDMDGQLRYFMDVNTQFLTDERGQKVAVVIPIADYEDLMEDVADLACVAERRDEERISLAELKKQLSADGLLPH